MKIYLRLIKPVFGLDCVDFEFHDVDSMSNGTHLVIFNRATTHIEFKCQLDNIDSFVEEE